MNHPAKNYIGRAPNYHLWDEARFCLDTMHMHWLAKNLYRTLLQTAWQLSTRPDLPDDDEQLSNIACGGDQEVWAKHRSAVRAMLSPDNVNGVDVLWQGRLRRDWKELEERRQTLQNAGRKGGKNHQARLKASSSHTKAESNQGSSPVKAREVKEVERSKESKGKGSKEEREAKSAPSAPDKTLAPSPSLSSQMPETNQGSGQEQSDAVKHLSGVCYSLTRKTPKPSDVLKLLVDYSAAEIEAALREFVDGIEERELPYVELLFFAQGGAAGVITARQLRDRDRSLKLEKEAEQKRQSEEWIENERRKSQEAYRLLEEKAKEPKPTAAQLFGTAGPAAASDEGRPE